MTNRTQSSLTETKGRLNKNHHRKAALIAGFSLLMMTAAIILAEMVAMAGIIVESDLITTIENILANQSRLRFGIFAFLVVAVLDLVVAWAFYVFLKPAKDDLSLLAAWSRLVYTIILGMAIIQLYNAVQLLAGSDLTAADPAQLQSQSMFLLNAFRETWDIGYVFFGIHLLLLGIAAFRSGFIPKAIGILLLLAGISYLIDYLGWMLFPDLGLGASFIFGYGELIFMVWLLIWGGKRKSNSN